MSVVAPAPLVAELDDVEVAYGQAMALRGLRFAVRRGEMFGLVGPDGAGKTTAIRTLLGLLPTTAGHARVLGADPRGPDSQVKRSVGYLSQRFTLYGDLTVAENIEFFGEIHRVADMAPRLASLLEFTLLGPYQRRRADQLSGGMQKKLALACTLIHQPQLLLLDEPTTGVDPVSRREFWSLLHRLLQDGLSVLLTTPYLDEAERCTRVALVHAGRTLAEDDPSSLRRGFAHRVLEVVCQPVRRAQQLLQASPRVALVHPYGDRLRLIPRRRDDDLADLLAALDGQQVRLDARREVAPSLEDVFIERVARASAEVRP
jgi:ABC-2 type transport system ATP-binding protein